MILPFLPFYRTKKRVSVSKKQQKNQSYEVMKRTINSPTGQSPLEKKKPEINMEREGEDDAASVRSGVSATSSIRREMDREFCFGKVQDKERGPWRDVITVDILTVNDQDYKGTVRPREALEAIYKTALNQNIDNLHGIKIEFRGHPVINFRLKTEINIDQVFGSENFSYNRITGSAVDRIAGKIRGVRFQRDQEDFSKFNRKRIKVKNCNWGLTEDQIMEWLLAYGKVLIPLNEETLDLSEGEEGDDDIELGSGDYWVTMELSDKIPQFLPMYGKKVEVYYRGMDQLCLNCYEGGHKRVDCDNDKKEWMDYVVDFIGNHEFNDGMYGRWVKIARAHRRKTNQKPNQQARDPETVPTGSLEPEITMTESAKDTNVSARQESFASTLDIAKLPNSAARDFDEEEQKNLGPWKTASYRNSASYKKNTDQSQTYADKARAKNQRPTYSVGDEPKKIESEIASKKVTRSSSRRASVVEREKQKE